jgi:hypothetical protein
MSMIGTSNRFGCVISAGSTFATVRDWREAKAARRVTDAAMIFQAATSVEQTRYFVTDAFNLVINREKVIE